MIQFQCQCGKRYQVPEQYTGKKVRCKECDGINIIPLDSPEEPTEETSYQEVSSSNKILIILCLGIIVFIAGSFGFLIYSQHTKVKECLVACEELHTKAQIKWDNKDYAGAREIYKNIIGRALEVSSDNNELASLTEDAKEKVQEAERLLFVEEYLAEIKEKYQQAENLFMSAKIPESQKAYLEIISFIKENRKEEDYNFSWIKFACQRRIELIPLMQTLLDNPEGYKTKSRPIATQEYDQIIKELASIQKPSYEIENLLKYFEQLKLDANVYYDEQDRKKRLADIREKELVAIELEKKRRYELRGFNKDYPIEINSSNVHQYFYKFFNGANNLSEALDNKSYYQCVVIPSYRRSNIKEMVLCEEDNATSWGIAGVTESYFFVEKQPNASLDLSVILHSEALNIRTKPDGKMNIREQNVKLFFEFASAMNKNRVMRHLEDDQPVILSWLIDLNQSGKLQNYKEGQINVSVSSVSYKAKVIEYEIINNSDPRAKALYGSLKNIEDSNRKKTVPYLLKLEKNPKHDPQLQQALAHKSEENVNQLKQQMINAQNRPRLIAEPYIERLISSGFIKSATFECYTNFRGDQISITGIQPGEKVYVKYRIEYYSKANILMYGNIGVLVYVDDNFNWKYGEIYFNGKELWIQGVSY